MANAQTFEAIVKVTDRAVSPLRAITERVQGLGAATETTEKKLEQVDRRNFFSRLSGNVKQATGNVDRLGAAIGAVHSRVSSLIPAVGGLAAVFSLKGVIDQIGAVSERRAEALARFDRVGGDPATLGALSASAKVARVDIGTLDSALIKLGGNMAAAAGGKDKDVAGLFRQLGISLRDSKGNIRDATDVFEKLSAAWRNTSSSSMRDLMLKTLFGKQGKELTELLKLSTAEMKQLADASKSVRFAFTPKDDQVLKEYRKETMLLQGAVTGMTDSIAVEVAPVVLPMVRELRLFLSDPKNRKDFAQGFREVAIYVRDIDWRRIGTDIRWVGGGVRYVVDEMGGLHRVVELFIAYKAGKWAWGIGTGLTSIIAEAKVAKAALLGVREAAVVAGESAAFAPLIARLVALARVLGPIAAVIAVMWPTETASPDKDEAPPEFKPKGMPDSAKLSRKVADHPGWMWGTHGLTPAGTGVLPDGQLNFNIPPTPAQRRIGQTPMSSAMAQLFGRTEPAGAPDKPINFNFPPLGDGARTSSGLANFPRLGDGARTSSGLANFSGLPPLSASDSNVKITVDLNNAPAGTRVETESTGSVPPPTVNVGYANPLGDVW